MKILFSISFVLFTVLSFGQDKKIEKLKTIQQADAFIKSNPNLGGEIIVLNSGTDTSELAEKIYTGKSGSPLTMDGYTYKIIETKNSFLIRVSYINLMGDSITMVKIDSLRKVIISKYNNGSSFPDLAKEYNMDGNPNCDLGWVPEEMLLTDFSAAIKKHKTGELFTINIPDKKWYYVTLKTFEERKVKVYSVLIVKNLN